MIITVLSDKKASTSSMRDLIEIQAINVVVGD